MSDFHRASLEMAWLRLCRITNESTEIENCYSGLNGELRWLWNSVYNYKYIHLLHVSGYTLNSNHSSIRLPCYCDIYIHTNGPCGYYFSGKYLCLQP